VPELSEAEIRAAFEKFRGDFYQMRQWSQPKNMAACRSNKLARQGKVVEREPRFVHVYRHTIDRIALPEIDFSVLCSKGFYVRTYAHDIGQILGCGAHLKSLRRTRSGRFDVGNAISVEQIKELPREKIAQRILRCHKSHVCAAREEYRQWKFYGRFQSSSDYADRFFWRSAF